MRSKASFDVRHGGGAQYATAAISSGVIGVILCSGTGKLHQQITMILDATPLACIAALIDHGAERLERGEYASAEDSLLHALTMDANQCDALRLMGDLRYRQRRFSEAVLFLMRSLQAKPEQPEAQILRGYSLRDQQDTDGAISAFQAAIILAPEDPGAHFALAGLLRNAGELEHAELAYRKVLALSPDHIPAKLGLGGVLIGAGRPVEGEAIVRNALTETKDGAVIGKLEQALGMALGLQNRVREQAECYRRAQVADPHLTHLEHRRASLLASQGYFEEAIPLFQRVLSREPLNLAAHKEYNNLLYCLRRDDDFLRSYDEAVAQGSDPVKLEFGKATFLALAGRLKEALEIYDRLRAVDPANLDAQVGAALTLGHMERLEPAFEVMQAVLSRCPENANLCGSAALIAARMGEPQKAITMAEQGLATDPHEQLCLAMLGTSYRMMGDARAEWLHGYSSLIRVFDLEAPEGYRDMAEFNVELNAYLDRLHRLKREFVDQSLRGGSQTYNNVFDKGHKPIDLLHSRIDEVVRGYIADLKDDGRHPFLRRRTTGFSYNGSWSSRLGNEGFHVNHVHTHGWISSCYYVEVPESTADNNAKQGWLKFGEPRFDVPMTSPVARTVQPVTGRLVLFPSYTWHGTIPFRATKTRTTVAFDVIPK